MRYTSISQCSGIAFATRVSVLLTLFLMASGARGLAVTKSWIGVGAGGSGTDFNNATNWSPAGVPGSSDDVVINFTSTATIQLSATVVIKSLVLKSLTAGQTGVLDISGFTLTINETALVEGNPGKVRFGENGAGSGMMYFGGDFTITSSNEGVAGLIGNATSQAVFLANVNVNISQNEVVTGLNSNVLLDAPGSQTITWNANQNINFRNVAIGSANNPTVILAGSVGGTINSLSGDLTVNGSSVLNLNDKQWNSLGGSSTFALNNTATLIVTKTDGGIGSSNFPASFGTYSLASASTVQFNGGQVPELPGSVKYGHVIINSSTQAHYSVANLRIAGDFTINASRSFDLQGKNMLLEGNWFNSGTFTPNNGTVILNGSANQSIGGSAVTTFRYLTMDKPSGEAVLQIDANVEDKLKLTNGLITTGSYRVQVGNANYLGSIEGGSAASYVNGRMERGVVSYNTSFGTNSELLFPVGKGGNYRPVILNFASLNENSWVSVERFTTGFHGTASAGYVTPNAYWLVTLTGGSTYNYTIRLDGTGTPVPPDPSILKYDGTTVALAATYSAPYYSRAGLTSFSEFALAPDETAVLPVTLSGFGVKKVEASAKLAWSTTEEAGFDRFEIERSTDPLNGFEKLGTVVSAGNKTGSSYSFFDSNLSGAETLYYRLKMVDLDDSFAYSKIISLVTDQKIAIEVYPNPSADRIYINADNWANVSGLKIHNQSGQTLIRHSGRNLNRELTVSDLAAGLYILELTRSDGRRETTRVLINR